MFKGIPTNPGCSVVAAFNVGTASFPSYLLWDNGGNATMVAINADGSIETAGWWLRCRATFNAGDRIYVCDMPTGHTIINHFDGHTDSPEYTEWPLGWVSPTQRIF